MYYVLFSMVLKISGQKFFSWMVGGGHQLSSLPKISPCFPAWEYRWIVLGLQKAKVLC